MEIWIASHIDQEQRLGFLKSSLARLQKYNVKVSMSHDIKVSIPPNKNHTIYYHDKPKKQFEHLQYLNSITHDKKIKVIFLDDDDILFDDFLESKELQSQNAGLGFQCRNVDPHDYEDCLNLKKVYEIFKESEVKQIRKEAMKLMLWEQGEPGHSNARTQTFTIEGPPYQMLCEFSGTFCLLHLLDDFFRTKPDIDYCTDLVFRHYLAMLGYTMCFAPNVFGRRWCVRSYWMHRVGQDFQETSNQTYKDLDLN